MTSDAGIFIVGLLFGFGGSLLAIMVGSGLVMDWQNRRWAKQEAKRRHPSSAQFNEDSDMWNWSGVDDE
jgi:hypothetical protein